MTTSEELEALCTIDGSEDLLKDFVRIPNNYGKVEFVKHLLADMVHNLDDKYDRHPDKNHAKCLAFRKLGNEMFTQPPINRWGALEKFNRSICFAESGSANAGVGYMNRSAVLLDMKRFRECKKNISLLRKTSLPDHFKAKMIEREQLCERLKADQVNDTHREMDETIKHNVHPSVDCISAFLELTETDTDWGIRSRGKLGVGDLVSVEVPYCASLYPHADYSYCAYCLKEDFFTLIPCPNCTNTMYCNEDCMRRAYEMFHKYECPISEVLKQVFNRHYIGVRALLISLNLFDDFDEFMAFCRDPTNQHQNVFTLDQDKDRKKEDFRAFLGLVKNSHRKTPVDLFHIAVMTTIARKYLVEYSPLGQFIDTKEKLIFFTDILYTCLQICDYNICDIPITERRDPLIKHEYYASAIYNFGSLINHSDRANVVRVFSGVKCFVFTLARIRKYKDIFVNYNDPSIAAVQGIIENFPLRLETIV